MKAPLPHRVLFDSEGVKRMYAKFGCERFKAMMYSLMYVNTNSLHNKKRQIVASQKSFGLISEFLKDKLDEEKMKTLTATFRPIEDDDLEEIEEETRRTWEYANVVSAEIPYQTIIFTDVSSREKYEAYKDEDKKENIYIIVDEGLMREKILDYVRTCREYKQQ